MPDPVRKDEDSPGPRLDGTDAPQLGTPALVVVIEIDEQGQRAPLALRPSVRAIAVPLEVLAGLVAVEPKALVDPDRALPWRPWREMGDVSRPDELAAAVLWLCCPGASFVVGVALPVDGGYTCN